jgi:hypothetical protein
MNKWFWPLIAPLLNSFAAFMRRFPNDLSAVIQILFVIDQSGYWLGRLSTDCLCWLLPLCHTFRRICSHALLVLALIRTTSSRAGSSHVRMHRNEPSDCMRRHPILVEEARESNRPICFGCFRMHRSDRHRNCHFVCAEFSEPVLNDICRVKSAAKLTNCNRVCRTRAVAAFVASSGCSVVDLLGRLSTTFRIQNSQWWSEKLRQLWKSSWTDDI